MPKPLVTSLCALLTRLPVDALPLAAVFAHAMILAGVATASVSRDFLPIITSGNAAHEKRQVRASALDYEITALTRRLALATPTAMAPFPSRSYEGPFERCHENAEAARRIACLGSVVDQLRGSALAAQEKRRLQLIPPAYGLITSGFGYRRPPAGEEEDGRKLRSFHDGIDIAAPRDAMFVAAADGIVIFAERQTGYGAMIDISHKQGYETRYAHAGTIFVKPGQRVRRGQALGVVGLTGRSTGPHLHYEVRIDGEVVDPRPYVDLPTVQQLHRSIAAH